VEIDFAQSASSARAYYKVNLTDVLLSSDSISSGGDRPSESISLNFTKIALTSISLKGESQTFSFDLAEDKSSIVAAAPLAPASSTVGGDPIYMKYGSVSGDVAAAGHKDWIELNSFQWGVTRSIGSPTTGAGRSVGRQACRRSSWASPPTAVPSR